MKRALLAALLIALVATPATAGPSAAEPAPDARPGAHSVRLHDARGDTWRSSDNETGDVVSALPAADVLRAGVAHGRHAVRVRMDFDNLRRALTQWYYVEVHTPGATSWFIVEADRPHTYGIAYQDVKGEWVRVPGLRHSIDYARDVMTFRVPRSLLGDPPWVRVRLHNVLGVGEGVFYTDNPFNTGRQTDFTPRIPARPLTR
jgi:hypothetical protein